MTTYTPQHVSQVSAEMLRDINTQGKEWCVVRKSETRESVWSFHNTLALAQAAARRWRSRDIVTR